MISLQIVPCHNASMLEENCFKQSDRLAGHVGEEFSLQCFRKSAFLAFLTQ